MPLHGYTTDRRPPTNVDHILAHPYSMGIAFWQIFAGLTVLLTIVTDLSVSESLDSLPDIVMASVGVLLLVGGASVIRGLLNDDDDLMVGWRIERFGLILSATGWAAYAVTQLAAMPDHVLSWTSALVFTVSHLTRYRATRLEEKRVRARIAEHAQP